MAENEAKVKGEAKPEVKEPVKVDLAAEAEEKKKKIAREIIDAIYKTLNREQKKVARFKAVVTDRYLLLSSRLERQESAERGTSIYPEEQVRQFRAELHAIKKGLWLPGWKVPKRMSPYDTHMAT